MDPIKTAREVLAIRQRLGLRQVDLATRMGVSERTVIRWEDEGVRGAAAMLLARLEEEA